MAVWLLFHEAQQGVEVDGLAKVGNPPIVQSPGKDVMIGGGDQNWINGWIEFFQNTDQVDAVHPW